jgi:acyl-coenzyme A thioesterase PaaI-like protein
MLGLCDVSLYIAILAQIGPVALAVTTNLNINFLRRPQARDLLGECQLIKLGKGSIPRGRRGPSHTRPGTYSIPPQ